MIIIAMGYQHKLSDKELLENWRGGDAMAFDILFKRYYQYLAQYAKKNVPNEMVAEELVMDVMFRVWKKAGHIECTNTIKTYLSRCLKNAIFNHYRTFVHTLIALEDMPEEQSPLAKPSDNAIHEAEMETFYEDTLSNISEKKQRVFRLSREENLTYAEISKKLGISVNTVENYMASSLATCRKTLSDKLDILLTLAIVSYSFAL